MAELDFITDMVEEKLVKGNLRWLANFNEIHRDYPISDIAFPIYASGSLQERGSEDSQQLNVASPKCTGSDNIGACLLTLL